MCKKSKKQNVRQICLNNLFYLCTFLIQERQQRHARGARHINKREKHF